MRGAVEAAPQLPDGGLLERMHELGSELRERPEHVRAAQQVRPRKLERGIVAHRIAI
jgi:hypothetical protein